MSLPLPETPERAIRAGSISDVAARLRWRSVGEADGGQTFLPVGAT